MDENTLTMSIAMDTDLIPTSGYARPRPLSGVFGSHPFIAFLTRLDQTIAPHLTVYLVMDNGSSHTSKAT
ncbi:hypothetical protein, partial [Acrocarpospora corrugata]